jgi:hypothetical protein
VILATKLFSIGKNLPPEPLQMTSFANRQPARLFRRQKLLFLPLTIAKPP